MRNQSNLYYRVRDHLKRTVHSVRLSRYDLARLARAAIDTGYALQDARGGVYLVTRNHHV